MSSAKAQFKRGLALVLDRISLYVPFVLMATLALLTWWLLRLTPTFEPDVPEPPPRHVVDYHMKNFAVRSFNKTGELKGEFLGQLASHYPDTDTLEVDALRVTGKGSDQQSLTATSDRALVNGDATELQLMGHAQVISSNSNAGPNGAAKPVGKSVGNTAPIQLNSEFLHVWINEERVRTDRPVRITQGSSQIDADSLNFDKNTQTTLLQGRVRAVFTSPAKAPSKSVTNPSPASSKPAPPKSNQP
jgi:lipopolysaccharide export system protein LptC